MVLTRVASSGEFMQLARRLIPGLAQAASAPGAASSNGTTLNQPLRLLVVRAVEELESASNVAKLATGQTLARMKQVAALAPPSAGTFSLPGQEALTVSHYL